MARNGSKIAKRKDCDLFYWSVFNLVNILVGLQVYSKTN